MLSDMGKKRRKKRPADAPPLGRPVTRDHKYDRMRSIRISDELWDAAKIKAAHNDTTMNAVIRAFLERWIKR